MISIPIASRIPSVLVAATFVISGLMAGPPAAVIARGDDELPIAVLFLLMSLLPGAVGLLMWRYRHQRRNSRLEVHADGLTWVVRDVEEFIPWSDISRISVNKRVARRTECPAFRIQLLDGRIIRVSSPTGALEAISVSTSNKVSAAISIIERATQNDRAERMYRELEAGKIVEVGGGLSVSKYVIRVGRRELSWGEVAKLERHLLLLNGHGTPNLEFYHRTKCERRPSCIVVEANVWDADVFLPFCLTRIRMASSL